MQARVQPGFATSICQSNFPARSRPTRPVESQASVRHRGRRRPTPPRLECQSDHERMRQDQLRVHDPTVSESRTMKKKWARPWRRTVPRHISPARFAHAARSLAPTRSGRGHTRLGRLPLSRIKTVPRDYRPMTIGRACFFLVATTVAAIILPPGYKRTVRRARLGRAGALDCVRRKSGRQKAPVPPR